MTHDNNAELFPLVDENGLQIGSATRGECHNGSKLLHPVVHLHIFDSEGRLYLQKRPEWKTIQPGKWDTAVGGHVDYGEDIPSALRREAHEEIGLVDFQPKLIKRYVFESDIERELVHTFITTADPDQITPSDELDGGRWWTLDDLHRHSHLLTPNLLAELPTVLSSLPTNLS